MKVGVVDVDVRVSSHFKEELAWAVDKRLRVISTVLPHMRISAHTCMGVPYEYTWLNDCI